MVGRSTRVGRNILGRYDHGCSEYTIGQTAVTKAVQATATSGRVRLAILNHKRAAWRMRLMSMASKEWLNLYLALLLLIIISRYLVAVATIRQGRPELANINASKGRYGVGIPGLSQFLPEKGVSNKTIHVLDDARQYEYSGGGGHERVRTGVYHCLVLGE